MFDDSSECTQVTVNLYPTVIRVVPEPLMDADYFFQRDVFSDGPALTHSPPLHLIVFLIVLFFCS